MPRWFVIVFAVLLPLQLAWSSAAHLCVDAHDGSLAHAVQHEDEDADTDLEADLPCASVGGHCHGHLSALPVRLHAVTTSVARFQSAPPAAEPIASRPLPRPDRPQWPTLA